MAVKLVRAKKSLGQHFLTDLSIAGRIADTVDERPDLPVLEVGPGMGVLTQFLRQKPQSLKVAELDWESVEYLRRQWPDMESRIIEDDFLKMHLEHTFDGRQFILTGNYPYNISSQIFFKMLEYRDLIPLCTGMIQREVALRLAAKPGCKDYGILSVLVQAYYDVEYLFTVEPEVFNPPPKVRSAVVAMRRNSVARLDCDEAFFKQLVKTLFNQRRKMIRGSIKPLLAELQAKGYNPVLPGEVATMRPEQLSVKDFVCLTRHLKPQTPKTESD